MTKKMKSKSGTTILTDKNGLTPITICRIIKSCGDAKVSELKFGNLHISFKAKEDSLPRENKIDVSPYRNSDADEIVADIEQQTLQDIETESKADELANMPIVDPVAYEDGLASGDFIDLGEANAES